MASSSFNSPNFGFLAKHDNVLVRHAALAERYVFDDANSALIKLRQFAELLSKHSAAYAGITVEQQDTFLNVLDKLWNGGVLGAQVSQLFHGLRKSGNAAAHDHSGDRREALHQLQMARKLAVWFHRSFGGDKNFEAGSFIVPPDPAAAEKELLDELNRLREAEVAARNKTADLQATLETELRQKAEAEANAQIAFDDLKAALELAEESEQQLQAEREKFQQKLAELQAQTAAAPADQRKATVAAAQQHEAEVHLDEQATRRIIDAQLRDAGWEADSQTLRYAKGTRPVKGHNIAIAEWPTANGPADYVLFVGLLPVAALEAKKFSVSVASRVDQAARYSAGFHPTADFESNGGPWNEYNLPFAFASNGRPYLPQITEQSGVWFHDLRETTNKPRALKSWYTPDGLAELLEQDITRAESKLAAEPLDYLPLYDFQRGAIEAVESQLADGHRRILIAMATGTGKTRTCLGMLYRFIKTNRFRRVLFLVDRTSLGEQAEGTFENVKLENYQSFDDIYDIKKLGSIKPDSDTRLQVATVQGMCKRILGADDSEPVPIDWYDCIIVDECHRGYGLDMEMSDKEMQYRSPADYLSRYRQVLDHFDAVRIGLTATPAQHTSEIFGPPVFEYSYRQAVIDDYLCDHEPPYRFVTDLNKDGMVWKKGEEVDVFHTGDKTVKKYQTPDEIKIEVGEFNKRAITENFNRVVCRELINHIDFDGNGKTLIYCVNDDHADRVVRILKEELDDAFGAFPNDAVKKITGSIDKPSETIRRYKNEFDPRVAVTVDLLTTGIDVPEITNLVFLRRVSSRILYDQMLGRATRKCPDLHGEGSPKTAFRIFDAVDLYNALLPITDMKPVVARPNLSFAQLAIELRDIDDAEFTEETKRQFLGKLRRRKLTETQEGKLLSALQASGDTLKNDANLACELPALPKSPRNVSQATNQLCGLLNSKSPQEIAAWIDTNPKVLEILDDTTSAGSYVFVSKHDDVLRSVAIGYGTATKPEDYIESFRKYVIENQDKIPALIVVTTRPRDLTRAQLRELKLTMDEAGFTEQNLRVAVRETTNQDIAATIIAYIRYVALGQPLVPHAQRVQAAMAKIMASRAWTEPQRKWLERIGRQLEQEVIVDRDAIDDGQFKQMGGFTRLNKVFKGELETILRDIADAMWQTAA
jgi:type I restriction enzyme R subunit